MKSNLTHGSEEIVQVEMQNKKKWSEGTQSHRRGNSLDISAALIASTEHQLLMFQV